jgi:gamma-glutamylcyclotransferase (GGCT)/AIG2-like uncharacterized protein YtfP
MKATLFVYGTLRDPDILSGVLDRAVEPEMMAPASAPGFAVVYYPGRVYPALVPRQGSDAMGALLTGLSAMDLQLLDAFEGDEYRREPIQVQVGNDRIEATAYLPVIDVGSDALTWTLKHWQEAHKADVLAGERASAALLRAKLTAIRPS